ncbi:MAG: acyl-CoA thioesterase [Chloroflexi bacterium]|nr:acyl-CoA thioesterase [Chloroflexota bacterium]
MERERFGYFRGVEVQWRDVDPLNHLNHAAYLSYVEHARMRYFDEVLGHRDPQTTGWVIVDLRCRFRAPVNFPDTVTCGFRFSKLGRTSAHIEFGVWSGDGTLAADGEGVLVYTDPTTAKASPIPDEWRRRIVEFERLDPAPT